MPATSPYPHLVRAIAAAAIAAAASRAAALQPLQSFLEAAREGSPDAREARANAATAAAQAEAARGKLLPGLSARATYTRNQYDTTVTLPLGPGGADVDVTLNPQNQLEGSATIGVPLLDLAAWARAGASGASAASARESERATRLQVESAVVQDYHQLVANLGLVEASRRALETARAGLDTAQERFQAGSAASLDVDRARAEVERQVQQLAAAELAVELTRRSLQSRTGLPPDDGPAPAPADDLHEEAPLAAFEVTDTPSIRAAVRAREAAEDQAAAQRRTLLPVLAASLTEHGSNAPGLTGQEWAWQAQLTLSWALDFTTSPAIRAQATQADAARAREDRARLAAQDAVHRAWNTVRSTIPRSRSARAQAEVSAHAADLARDRYAVGAGTQLELLQAERDLFAAEAARLQADADLANARAQLQLAAGRSLLADRETP